MTQEEKLKVAKRLYQTANADQRYVFESLFPELKESEDGRIRKNIIATIHLYYGEPLDDEAKEMIAWLEKQGEQKPAWSEDDEDNFKHLMDEIVCLGNNRNSANRLYYDRLIKFIKELKNRVQPKEKWCEKDERMLDRLIAYFEKRVAFTDDDNPKYASWLKSLRPQNTWKPSDEQMEVLLSEVKGWTKGCPKQIVLESFLSDLKKLREE